MNWAIILEIVGVVGGISTLIALMLGPMFYLGSKIDNLRKEFKQDLAEFRKEVRDDMNEFRKDMDEFRKETKDFHGRLCAIEERNRK